VPVTRRDVLKTSLKASAAAVGAFAGPLRAAAPELSQVTPALIDAARKEGRAVW
jgi:iron(III) transport system substrate-binding protein